MPQDAIDSRTPRRDAGCGEDAIREIGRNGRKRAEGADRLHEHLISRSKRPARRTLGRMLAERALIRTRDDPPGVESLRPEAFELFARNHVRSPCTNTKGERINSGPHGGSGDRPARRGLDAARF